MFDFRIWIVLALILLFPNFFKMFWERKFRFDSIDFLIILLIILMMISYGLRYGLVTGLGQLEKGFVYIFLPYFAGKHFISTPKDLNRFFISLLLGAILVSIMGLYEWETGDKFYDISVLSLNTENEWLSSTMVHERTQVKRIAATFIHPIWYGIFIVLASLINVLLLIFQRKTISKRHKVIIIIQLLLAIPAVIMSQSRTAIVSVVIALFLSFFLFKKYKVRSNKITWVIPGLITISILFTFGYFIIKQYYYDYYLSVAEVNIYSKYAFGNFYGRINTYLITLKKLTQYPNFFSEALIFSSDFRNSVRALDMTSGILVVAIYNGVIAGVIYVMIWIKSMYRTYRLKTIYAFITLVVIIFLFIADNGTTLRFQISIIRYILIGLSFNKILEKEWVISKSNAK